MNENEIIITLKVGISGLDSARVSTPLELTGKTMRVFLYTFFFITFAVNLNGQTDEVYTGTVSPQDSIKRRQPKKNREWLEKVTYEGNIQFQLGAYTFFYFSPTIGYSPVKKLNVGLGVIYNYISINYGQPYGKVSQSVFGGHSYARYFVTDVFFVQGQYDKLRQPDIYGFNREGIKWVDYVFVGGGFRKPIGDKIGLSATILYNLTPSILSIYPNRLILQFGFMGTF